MCAEHPRREELFWSECRTKEEIANAEEAARICMTPCPVLERCRLWAEAWRPVGGIWAGQLWARDRSTNGVTGVPAKRNLLAG
jgi:hypothetical protein